MPEAADLDPRLEQGLKDALSPGLHLHMRLKDDGGRLSYAQP